jgi:hypothetical protein
VTQIISDFLNALTAREPAPGGGTTATLHVVPGRGVGGDSGPVRRRVHAEHRDLIDEV